MSYDEFVTVIKKLSLKLKKSQILDLALKIDKDKDGFIQYEEFTAGFNVGAPFSDRWTRNQFTELFEIYMEKKKHRKKLSSAYKKCKSGKGLTYTEFGQLLNTYFGKSYSKEEVEKLALAIDVNNSDLISYHELKAIFSPPDTASDALLKEFVSSFASAKTQVSFFLLVKIFYINFYYF